jgi:hypothetical protein
MMRSPVEGVTLRVITAIAAPIVAALGLAAALGAVAPKPAVAQTIDVGGHLGVYAPVGPLVQSGDPTNPGTLVQKRLQLAILAGIDAVVWAGHGLGLAASATYVPSNVAVTGGNHVSDVASSVILLSGRVLYALTPLRMGRGVPTGREAPVSAYLGLGAGAAMRRGAVWNYSSGLTSPALVLNAGGWTPLGSRTALRVDVADYVSRVRFDAGLPTETAARWHHDVVVSVSFAFRARR